MLSSSPCHPGGDVPQQGKDLCMQTGEKGPGLDPVGKRHSCGFH